LQDHGILGQAVLQEIRQAEGLQLGQSPGKQYAMLQYYSWESIRRQEESRLQRIISISLTNSVLTYHREGAISVSWNRLLTQSPLAARYSIKSMQQSSQRIVLPSLPVKPTGSNGKVL
jgi:hypothetical protein